MTTDRDGGHVDPTRDASAYFGALEDTGPIHMLNPRAPEGRRRSIPTESSDRTGSLRAYGEKADPYSPGGRGGSYGAVISGRC